MSLGSKDDARHEPVLELHELAEYVRRLLRIRLDLPWHTVLRRPMQARVGREQAPLDPALVQRRVRRDRPVARRLEPADVRRVEAKPAQPEG